MLADELESVNTERREIAAAALADAEAQVAALGQALPAALVVQSAFPSGVLGLVAVKLSISTGRTVAVVEQAEGVLDRLAKGDQ